RPRSVAPMRDRTDRHFRLLVRRITRHTLLYTPMLTPKAVIFGDREKLLGFYPEEKPLSLQLGGDDPEELAEAGRIAADLDFDEINLNIGCPSTRVQAGSFGASLMARPGRVAEAVEALRSAVDLPITVKSRIGIEGRERYEDLLDFVDTVAGAGCDRFTVHARIAILKGLDPKQNRSIPPLRYHDVHRLKEERPDLLIEINGGILNLDQVAEQLERVDAVMLGRAAYEHPELFANADRRFFSDAEPGLTGAELVRSLYPHVEWWLSRGGRLHDVSRHLLNLFAGRPGARHWRRVISVGSPRPGSGIEVLEDALRALPGEVATAS
ncbi:MAG: tRNA dihydrouridine(20/20a) synthase DusA, partial [Acidobacteriota bacterium]